MFSESTLPPGLIQAYRETHYKVIEADELTLLVDTPNPALAQAHRQRRVDCSAFLTAWNPYSAELAVEENLARQAALAAALRSRGLVFVEGIGQHPSNGWEGESSFLVFGLSLAAAKALCTKFEQNALVWSGADAVPQLILLR